MYRNFTKPGAETLTTSFNLVDVRDVALGHTLALERPEAGGERFIVSNGPFFWAELRKSLIRPYLLQTFAEYASTIPFAGKHA